MQQPRCQNTANGHSGSPEEDLLLQKQQIRLQNFKKHLGGIKQRLRQVTSGGTGMVTVKGQISEDKENQHQAESEIVSQIPRKSPVCPVSRLADKGCSAKTLLSPSADQIVQGIRIPQQVVQTNAVSGVTDGAFSFRRVEKVDKLPNRGSPSQKTQSHTELPNSTHSKTHVGGVGEKFQQTSKQKLREAVESQIHYKSLAELPNSITNVLATIQEEVASIKPSGTAHYLRFSPVKQTSRTLAAEGWIKNASEAVQPGLGMCHASSPNFNTLRSAASGITHELSLSEAYQRSRAGIVKSMIRPRSNPPNLFGGLLADESSPTQTLGEGSQSHQRLISPKKTKKTLKEALKPKQSPGSAKRIQKSINKKSVDEPALSASSSAAITPSFQRARLRSVDRPEQEGPTVNRKLFLQKDSVENTVKTVRQTSTDRLGKDPLRHKATFSQTPNSSLSKLGWLDRSERTRGGSQMRRRLNLSAADSQHNTSCKLNQSSINTSGMELKHSSSKDTVTGRINTSLIQRLVKGARAEVSSREMKSRTGRLYQELPEVKAKKMVEESKELAVQRVQRIKAYDSVDYI